MKVANKITWEHLNKEQRKLALEYAESNWQNAARRNKEVKEAVKAGRGYGTYNYNQISILAKEYENAERIHFNYYNKLKKWNGGK